MLNGVAFEMAGGRVQLRVRVRKEKGGFIVLLFIPFFPVSCLHNNPVRFVIPPPSQPPSDLSGPL